MKNGLMLLANGFEQVEALTVQDTLNRTRQINLDCVSISDDYELTTSSNIVVKVNKLLKDIKDFSNYDFIVLPGGKLGVDNLKNSKLAVDTILKFNEAKKQMFAICAAPSIYEGLGLLNNKEFVCYPGFENGSGKWMDTEVVITDRFVTGRSMGYSLPFALVIVKKLLGQEAVDAISTGIFGIK